MPFKLTPRVGVDRDSADRIIQLKHTQERYSAGEAGLTKPTVLELCDSYVREVAPIYGIDDKEASTLSRAVTAEPMDEGVRLKRGASKTVLDTTVVSYQQTCGGLPVWNSELSVVARNDPPEVVSSSSYLRSNVDLGATTANELAGLAGYSPGSLFEALGVDESIARDFKLNRAPRLLVYRYDPEERVEGGGSDSMPPVADTNFDESAYGEAGFDPDNPPEGGTGSAAAFDDSLAHPAPTIPLPPVPASLDPGRDYVVREILFSAAVGEQGSLNWRAFVEPKSGAVLYLRALTAAANCCVFETDPNSKTGTPLTGASAAADLDAARTCGLTLQNLEPPVSGVQSLRGKWAVVRNTDPPPIAPPTTTSPFSFEYGATTDDFSAVNAYYHTDWMYRLVEGLGFDVASYFDGTTFPVPVDHRGEGGGVNAHANGNASGDGMGKFRYGLVQSGRPVGIATTVRVCLHEFGHALLWDHVDSPNFGWAHSAGDTLAAILNDPETKLSGTRRFETFPFLMASNPFIDRRHDRDVASGWAWGGSRDDRGYGSEQILSTLMFRLYRVTGGDDVNVNVRKFAARYLTYLIVRAIGTLTATTTDPRVFVTALENSDELTVDFEGHAGGGWHKVIRWTFEKQGLFQPPGAPAPVTTPGAPPPVDVFIDDGRSGEYQPYLPDFGASPGVWNRNDADGGTSNEAPIAGVTNFLYVKVGNRGTQRATGLEVKFFQGGSPDRWPVDWTPTVTPNLPGPVIPPGGDAVVGPFHWVPTPGSVSVLASASATRDTSNADTVNGPILNSRLIPHDNNLAQRDFKSSAPPKTRPEGERTKKVCCGSTPAGATDWKAYGSSGIYLDVDTSSCKFTKPPRYFTTLGGRSSHWATTGATSIYRASATGFRVYVRWSNGGSLDPDFANRVSWHINWIAVEE